MRQFTREEAIEFAKSKVWEDWDDEMLAGFQLFQDKLCVDFSRFHRAMESALERPIFTHEFGFKEGLMEEFLGKRRRPNLQEILNLVPKDKVIAVVMEEGNADG